MEMMERLEYSERSDYDKILKVSDGEPWRYYSKKKMKEVAIIEESDILGDLDPKYKGRSFRQLKRDSDGFLKLRRYVKRNSMTYKVCGYMICDVEGEEGVVRVIRKRAIGKLIAAIIILALILAGLFWWLNRDSGPQFEEAAIAYKMPAGTPKNEDKSKLLIPGYGDLVIEAGTSNLYVALINPEGNEAYFKYRIVLKKNSEILYESALLKPGTAVTDVKLKRTIEKGTYDVKIVVLPYALDDYQRKLNGGVVETTLIAK